MPTRSTSPATGPPTLLAPGETPYERIERAGAVGRAACGVPRHGSSRTRPTTSTARPRICCAARSTSTRRAALLGELDVPVEIVDNGIVHPLPTGLAGVAEIHAYHLMPPGVTKAEAIALDLARRGLRASRPPRSATPSTDVAMADAVRDRRGGRQRARGRARAWRPRRRARTCTRRAGERGDGWAEFAAAWLAARGGASGLRGASAAHSTLARALARQPSSGEADAFASAVRRQALDDVDQPQRPSIAR